MYICVSQSKHFLEYTFKTPVFGSANAVFFSPLTHLLWNLSIHPSVRLSVCLSVRLSICPSVHPSVRPSVRLSVCPSIYLSLCPSIHPSVCPSIYLSLRPSIHPNVSSYTHPGIFPNLYEFLSYVEPKRRYFEEYLVLYLLIFSTLEINLYRFETTWGWVNDDNIFGWTTDNIVIVSYFET